MFLILSALLSATAYADVISTGSSNWNCEKSAMSSLQERNSKNKLTALTVTMKTHCATTLKSPSGIKGLNRYLGEYIKTIGDIHSGPKDAPFRGMPGFGYSLTTKRVVHGDQLNVTWDIHLASNSSTSVVYSGQSTRVDASGNTANVRFINLDEEVTSDASNPNVFHFTMNQSVKVDRPAIALFEGMFISRVQDGIRTDFDVDLKDILNNMGKGLMSASHLE